MKFNTKKSKPHKKSHQTSQFSQFRATTETTETFDEEELEEITLEEALAKIDKYQALIDELNESKRKIIKNANMNDMAKKLRCKPYNDRIKGHRKDMKKYERVRAKHLGVLDKLSKGTPLYAFAYNCQLARKSQNIANKIIEQEREWIGRVLEEEQV